MERLTELLGYWNHSLPEKVDYADLVCAPAFARGYRMVYEDEYGYMVEGTIKTLEELQQYRKLEENGLLLRLPCKVGDMIFVVPSKVNYKLNVLNGYKENNRVYEQKVHEIRLYSNERHLLSTCDGICSVLSDAYRETWFLTRREAEAKLAEMKSGHGDD